MMCTKTEQVGEKRGKKVEDDITPDDQGCERLIVVPPKKPVVFIIQGEDE